MESSTTAELAGVALTGNTARQNGGAIFNTQGDLSLTNVLMHGNTAMYRGGAIHNFTGHLTVRQSTIAGNAAEGCRFADSAGGGIYNGTGTLEMDGSLCVLNVSDVDTDVSAFAANLFLWDTIIGDVHYRRLADGTIKTETIDPAAIFIGDPLTTTNPQADLRLAADSPAVDAADAATLPADRYDLDADGVTDEPLPIDLAGSPRVAGAALDLGALEYTIPAQADVDPSYLPGDLNGDGTVNTTDLDLIRGNWGSTVTAGDLAAGDASGDGLVGGEDLDIVRANWGAIQAAAADAVLGSLGADAETPIYGPARRSSSPSGRNTALSPRQFEMHGTRSVGVGAGRIRAEAEDRRMNCVG